MVNGIMRLNGLHIRIQTLTDLPGECEKYYTIDWYVDAVTETLEHSNLQVTFRRFWGSALDHALIASGVAFKTQEAAERNKYAVYKALTGKEWEEREDARHE